MHPRQPNCVRSTHRTARPGRICICRPIRPWPGRARAVLKLPAGPPVGALVLGHGAGGGVEAADLQAVTAAATQQGWSVALVEQPYRVAGRRAPAPAQHLDTAWRAVLVDLREGPMAGLPVVTGGRSSGARVACRCSGDGVARAVLC